jgi:hypothetical protein
MSTIKTNKFQTLDGLTYNVPIQVVTSSLGTADLGTTDTSTSDRTNLTPSYSISTTTTTWTNTSNLQTTITPKFSNSIIRGELCVYLHNNSVNNAAAVRIVRGNKIIWRPIMDTTGPYSLGWSSAFHHGTYVITFIDSPATTSPVTYSLQYRAYTGSSTFLFGPGSGGYGNGQYFILTEYAQ